MKRIITISWILILMQSFALGQETLDANNPNSFIFGGDQKQNTMTIDLLSIAIVDIEPDPNNGISFGGNAEDMEAGLPPMGGIGSNSNEELWLNSTFRGSNSPARIYVSSNQAVPIGITLKVEIISTSNTGNYFANPIIGQLTITQVEQILIDDIGNGYTGDGLNAGFQLKYTVDNPNGTSLPIGFEVQYTIKYTL